MSTLTATYSNHITDGAGNQKQTVYAGVSQLQQQFSNRSNQGAQQTGVMPNYGGGAEKCARCSKSVYLAEKKVGAGRSFHSSCFSCQTCNRKLDATTLSEHKGEIFCKTCYTRQFGMHGLVSGVTMTTENAAREVVRHSRRSSYGSDLDAPVITHQQVRPRAHSNDNMLRGETSAVQSDEVSKLFPWRNDVLPEQIPASATKGVENLVEKQEPRPKSQIGFEKIIEAAYIEGGHSSAHSSVNFQSPYSIGMSAMVDMPVISPPKRVDSYIIEPMEMPTVPTRNDQRSRSPSPTSRDVYPANTSRERQSDISENFSRLTLGEISKELYGNENPITSRIASENPVIKPTSRNDVNHRSRDSSPSDKVNSHRSSSPTSGYGSSGTHGKGQSRDSTSSPPSAFVPQHDYLNTRSSNSNALDRQPSSPSPSKGNYLPSPTIGGKYSALSALIKPHRPVSPLGTPNANEYDN